MKSLLLSLILLALSLSPLMAQKATDSIYRPDIRTVSLCRNAVDLEPPILALGTDDYLMLRFDLLGEQPLPFRYRIVHCNARWQVDSLEPIDYLQGFEDAPIEDHQFSFTTLQPYINYYQRVPSPYTEFLASGNYLLVVYLQGHLDSVAFTRKFYVAEQVINVEMSVGKPITAERIRQDQEVDVLLTASNSNAYLLSPHYLDVVVQQNGRIDNLRRLPFKGYASGGLSYRHDSQNIFPGSNCFRYFDISNLRTPMYNVQHIERYDNLQPQGSLVSPWYAFLRPEEDRSARHFANQQALNGGMKVNVWDRDAKLVEADYVWVNFTLPMSFPYMNGSVHIVGDLTQWMLDENSCMEWSVSQKAYTKRLLLKQGYYSYQLLFLPVGDTVGVTATLEGDHYETANHYSVFVYYRHPSERFDRLLAIKRMP